MTGELKGNLNPYIGRIGSERIAENFAKSYQYKENNRLKEASQGFEALFIQIMLRAMRNTVPKSSFSQKGLDYDIFMGMFDEEISKRISERNSIGLSRLIYNEIENNLNRKNSIPIRREKSPMKLNPETKPMPLNREDKDIKFKKIDSMYEKINKFEPIVEKAAKKYNLEPSLIKAVIAQESGGNNYAISSSGAKGLMQLKDKTAEELGVRQIFDPEENIFGGTAYLTKMLERNNGDLKLALASYNAGPGNVRKYGGIPPFKETNNYIIKVLNYFEMFMQKDAGLKLT